MINFCSLFSGSSGNSIFIKGKKTKVLIDAGKSGCSIETALKKINFDISDIDAILVTHEHSDHTRGIGILSRKYNIPVYANENTWNSMTDTTGEIDNLNKKTFKTNEEFEIGDIGINTFNIPHDASEPVGFNFFIGSKKVTVATDIGHINDDLFNNLKNSDILLIESNHDTELVKVCKYPYFLKRRILGNHGHLSNEAAGSLLCELINYGVNKVLLGHLSKENNFPELCYSAVKNILESKDIKIGKDIKIEVAPRDRTSTMYAI